MEEKAKYLEAIPQALEKREFTRIKRELENIPSADIAEIFEEIEVNKLIVLFRLVSLARRAEVFSYLPFEKQELLLTTLSDVAVTSIMNDMEPVARTSLLSELDPTIREKIVGKMSPNERKMAMELLAYPEDSIGRIMTTEFLSIRSSMRGYEAIEHIRWYVHFDDDAIHNLFVVNDTGKYVGDVTLAKITINPTQTIGELIKPPTAGLNAFDEDEEAVNHFRKYDITIAPVVDDNDIIIGFVTADDIFDVAEEEATEDVQQFGGLEALEDPYFSTPIVTLMRKRAGWLCFLLIGGFLTAIAMEKYEGVLQSYHYLIFYLPIIISSGGNSGTQAASIIIRSLAVKEMGLGDWYRVLKREIFTGIGLGLLLALVGGCLVLVKLLNVYAALTVALAIVSVVIFGALSGAMLPFIFKRINVDPAVSSSPLIAVLVDIVGVIIYLAIAQVLLF